MYINNIIEEKPSNIMLKFIRTKGYGKSTK